MEKKKVLFIMPSMFIGGAERSLLGVFDTFDYEKYDVYLFLYRHAGDFCEYIPNRVILLPEIKKYNTFDVPIKTLLMSDLWKFGVARILGKFQLKIEQKTTKEIFGVWASMQYISRSLQKLLPDIPGDYDVAISFLGIPDVLINKVRAKAKIAWNHTDYTVIGPYKEYDRKLYDQLNYIVSVSKPCTEQFLKVYPELSGKAVTVENIFPRNLIEVQADSFSAKEEMIDDGSIKLLSIGRFCEPKNFDNVPFICKKLIELGVNVKWYIIGFGIDESLIKEKILEAGMRDYVIILGKKDNPYPYIKACDIYVQPSRYEGKSVSVREAQILHKPVIITNYATAASQLIDGYDGVIVPMDNDGCADGIAQVIRDKTLLEMLIENTRHNDYTNSSEIEKIYRLIDDSSLQQ